MHKIQSDSATVVYIRSYFTYIIYCLLFRTRRKN